ncbi:hypothetical protein C8J56DRAFT_1055685 [Mycena floridula]|nr:hypothetical protein C8J56DRAFT_1055685 [Mycena floridula]
MFSHTRSLIGRSLTAPVEKAPRKRQKDHQPVAPVAAHSQLPPIFPPLNPSDIPQEALRDYLAKNNGMIAGKHYGFIPEAVTEDPVLPSWNPLIIDPSLRDTVATKPSNPTKPQGQKASKQLNSESESEEEEKDSEDDSEEGKQGTSDSEAGQEGSPDDGEDQLDQEHQQQNEEFGEDMFPEGAQSDRGTLPASSDYFDEDIDEDSPDEDERQAQAALRRIGENRGNFGLVGPPVNVLSAHHSRNRAPKPPNPEQLTRTASASSCKPVDTNKAQPPRKKRTVKPKALPTQLSYYKEAKVWKSILRQAKHRLERYIACNHAFPNNVDLEQLAREDIAALVEASSQDVESDHEMDDDMIKVITDQSWSFRSNVKGHIKLKLVDGYGLRLGIADNATEEEEVAHIQRRVTSLLDNSGYLHRIIDGITEYFAHPFIGKIIRGYFYKGTSRRKCLADTFPDSFQPMVSRELIAFIGTLIYNCLEELKTGEPTTINLDAGVYKNIYEQMLTAITDLVEADDVCRLQFETLRRSYAYDQVSGNHKFSAPRVRTMNFGINIPHRETPAS